VLQSSPFLEPPVAHDGWSGEVGGLQHFYSHQRTNFGHFWSGIISWMVVWDKLGWEAWGGRLGVGQTGVGGLGWDSILHFLLWELLSRPLSVLLEIFESLTPVQ
jgi:hypothetical protein